MKSFAPLALRALIISSTCVAPLVGASGCPADTGVEQQPDAGEGQPDAGAVFDGGGDAHDGGAEGDDGGARVDGGERTDAGLISADAGTARTDAGHDESDAGASDGGTNHDGGGAPDAPDAGSADGGASGADAGGALADGGTTLGYGADPARCGMTPYSWLDAASVGSVIEAEETNSFNAIVLALAIAQLENDGEASLQRVPSYDSEVHRMRYQTQDQGVLTDATGLVGIPRVDNGGEELPVLLFQHGTVGVSDPCSPSLDPAFGGDTYDSALVVGLIASFGYVVVAPDYLGLKSLGAPSPRLHSYLVGEPTAIASLDMVRAAKQYAPTVESGLTPGELLVMGASQGGHAAAFTTRLQPHYAPELPITAAIYGIPPTDLAAHIDIALGSVADPTSNAIAFGLGAGDWYDNADYATYFPSPLDVDLPAYVKQTCDVDILDGLDTLEEVFSPDLLAASSSPGLAGYTPWDCIIAENTLGTTSIPRIDNTPALFVVGENDTLVDTAVERASFTRLCADGYDMAYLECAGVGHTDGFLFSLDDQFDFLEDRMAGIPLAVDACQVSPAVTCSSAP